MTDNTKITYTLVDPVTNALVKKQPDGTFGYMNADGQVVLAAGKPIVNYGHGVATCPVCQGSGWVPVIKPGYRGPPRFTDCPCTFRLRAIKHVASRYAEAIRAAPLNGTSPLEGVIGESAWITAPKEVFARHAQRALVLASQPKLYPFMRVTDIDLMDGWLGKIINEDGSDDIFDGDVRQRQDADARIETSLRDMTNKAGFLIIHLGYKAALNKAVWGVFLEALNYREAKGLTTWVVDQPDEPFAPSHRAYSESAEAMMRRFKRVDLCEAPVKAPLTDVKGAVIGPDKNDPRYARARRKANTDDAGYDE